MVSVIAPVTAVRLSPQVFVFSTLGILLVDYPKVADTFSLEVCSMYAGVFHAFAAEDLELYHIYFWSYIVLLHFA